MHTIDHMPTADRIVSLPSSEDIPETFPKGRTCECGCGTILSIYNPGPRTFNCDAVFLKGLDHREFLKLTGNRHK